MKRILISVVLSFVFGSIYSQKMKLNNLGKKIGQGMAYLGSTNQHIIIPSQLSVNVRTSNVSTSASKILLATEDPQKSQKFKSITEDRHVTFNGKWLNQPINNQGDLARRLRLTASHGSFNSIAHFAYMKMVSDNKVRMDSVLILIKDIKTDSVVGTFCKKKSNNGDMVDWRCPSYSFPAVMRAATYLSVLENGGSPDSVVNTKEGVYVDVKGDTIREHNYQWGGYGIMSLEHGLMVNSDVAAVQSLEKFLPEGYATLEASLKNMGLRHQGIITNYQTMCQATMSPVDMLDWMANVAKGYMPGVSSENVKALQLALSLHVKEGLGKKANSDNVKSCGISYVTATDALNNYYLSFIGYFPYEQPLYCVYVEMYKDGKPATSNYAAEVYKEISELLTLKKKNINNTKQ
jgi:hypothetical protein